MYQGDRPKGRTLLYSHFRIAERFPSWFDSPVSVEHLRQTDPVMYAHVLAYAKIREGEEAEQRSVF